MGLSIFREVRSWTHGQEVGQIVVSKTIFKTLTEHQILEHAPKNIKDPGSKIWKQKYKNWYHFVFWLKEWRGMYVERGNRHPYLAQSSTSTSTENSANRTSDVLFPVILVLRKLWNALILYSASICSLQCQMYWSVISK